MWVRAFINAQRYPDDEATEDGTLRFGNALQWAAGRLNFLRVEILLKAGADATFRNRSVGTAIESALNVWDMSSSGWNRGSRKRIVDLLLQHGATPPEEDGPLKDEFEKCLSFSSTDT